MSSPLWYPTSNIESVPWLGSHGEHGLRCAPRPKLRPDRRDATAVSLGVRRARLESRSLEWSLARPRYGFSVHIHVAESDALARARAKPAYERFMHNFTYRFVRRGQPNRYADRASFDHELQRGRIIVGSPATVRDQLEDYLGRSAANYVLGCFSFGSLAIGDILESLDLFAREVMPTLRPTPCRHLSSICPRHDDAGPLREGVRRVPTSLSAQRQISGPVRHRGDC